MTFQEVLLAYVLSYPSGWKQGSHPNSRGPLGSTMCPLKHKRKEWREIKKTHTRTTVGQFERGSDWPLFSLWRAVLAHLSQQWKQKCREPTLIYPQSQQGVCVSLQQNIHNYRCFIRFFYPALKMLSKNMWAVFHLLPHLPSGLSLSRNHFLQKQS